MAFKDNKRYIKAFAMVGHASLTQFNILMDLLPPAKAYYSDEAKWYNNQEEKEIKKVMKVQQITRWKAFNFVSPWNTGKSNKTNIVEGVHNAFRNGIATLKRKSSSMTRNISLLQSKLNFISKRLSNFNV